MDVKNRLEFIKERISALSRREQFLAILVACVLVYALFELLVFTPQSSRKDKILATQQQTESQLNVLRTEIESISRRPPVSQELLAQKQSELEQLKRQVITLDAIASNTTSEAPRIGELVKGVLQSQHRNISLDSLKTLPVKTISTASASAARSPDRPSPAASTSTAVQANLFRHGVEIDLRGSYLDLLAYLRALEASSKAVFWSDARLGKTNTAELTLKVTIYMLSDQPNLRLS